MIAVGERNRPVCPACGFIYYLNPIVAAGALVEHDGKVALVQRGVEPGRGLWGLPSGYAEADESAEQAAARETWEEAHLRVEVEELLDAFSYGSEQDRGVLLIYAASVVSGELAAGDDATDAGWFGPDELPEIAFRTHREVLRQWRRARAVNYRRATLADAEVAVMLAEVHAFEQEYGCTAYVGNPNKALFVAVDAEQIVGFTALSVIPHQRTCSIEQIFVHPHYRRWGVGTQLIRTCVAFGKQEKLRAVLVEVPVSNPGWVVYLKAGFRVSGFTSNHYEAGSEVPEAALFLSCEVDP
jgi:ADP-ribose pyrophosphatase YjhB (NUDIX family)/GNAT superfamily N-acetyltransferase